MKENEQNNSKNILWGCMGCFGVIILISIIVGGCTLVLFPDDDKKEEKVTQTPVKTERVEIENISSNNDNGLPSTRKGNWKNKINKVAKSKLDESKKFDEIDQFAYSYSPSKKEVSEFVVYIIDQYTTQQYLKDISNDKKMLENIFKSTVVYKYYKNEQSNPYRDFAFDFYQNSKYVYRGVDTIGSTAVTSNERQMDKALQRINNKE